MVCAGPAVHAALLCACLSERRRPRPFPPASSRDATPQGNLVHPSQAPGSLGHPLSPPLTPPTPRLSPPIHPCAVATRNGSPRRCATGRPHHPRGSNSRTGAAPPGARSWDPPPPPPHPPTPDRSRRMSAGGAPPPRPPCSPADAHQQSRASVRVLVTPRSGILGCSSIPTAAERTNVSLAPPAPSSPMYLGRRRAFVLALPATAPRPGPP